MVIAIMLAIKQMLYLVDVGLSCRETEKRMKKLGLNIDTVKAIFVSHEHGDHIKGVSTLANKHSIPVYITAKTAKHGPRLISHISKSFSANQSITIGSLIITAFTKFHDAIDPHSFIISCNGTHVGVLTDIGKVCDEVKHYFNKCHAVFLESNYDEEMLDNGKYPIYLKDRIRGGLGHLSNKEALDLFVEHRSPALSHLLLSHLSKENNSPEIAAGLFEPYANGTKIIVASRYQPTDIFTVTGDIDLEKTAEIQKPVQLGLFE